MSSNIFVTFGSLAGTEQLQTRTRTRYQFQCNCYDYECGCQTCYEQCPQQNCYYNCEYFFNGESYSTNSDESFTPPTCVTGGTSVQCFCDDPWCTVYVCYFYRAEQVQVCTTTYVNCNPYNCNCQTCTACSTCCDWNAWSAWTDTQSCISSTPDCSVGTLQTECRVV